MDNDPDRPTQTIRKYCSMIVEGDGKIDVREIIKAVRSLSPARVLELTKELTIILKISTNVEIKQEIRHRLNQSEIDS